MSQFWLIASVLMCVAAFFVFWPVLRRPTEGVMEDQKGFLLDLFNESRQELEDQLEASEITQAEFEQLSSELEQGLLQDIKEQQAKVSETSRWSLLAFAALVVVVAVIFYQQRGAMADVTIQQLLEARYKQSMEAFQRGEESDPELTEELISQLSDRVDALGQQSENRYLLARLAAEEGKYGLAVEQYTELLQSSNKEDPRLMAELAQVVFLASGNRVTPEVSLLIRKSLELNPKETTALGLAGVESYETGRYEAAIEYWQAAIAVMAPGSPVVRGMEVGIERARSMLVEQGQIPEASPNAPVVEGESAVLTANVALADGVEVAANAVVLVYAREWGGRMPLAIKRFPVSELPQAVILDESMSMMPGVNIGTVDKLELVARISASGSARPESGDWQVTAGPLLMSEVVEPISLIVENQLP